MIEKRYLTIVGCFIAGGFVLVAMLNWLVNPFSLYQSPDIKGFNSDKVLFVEHLRLSKTKIVERLKPTSIILGTSRSGKGLSTSHSKLNSQHAYNMSAPSLNIYEMLRFFQHANAIEPQNRVILGIDYRSFTRDVTEQGFTDSRLTVTPDGKENSRYLFSVLSEVVSSLLSIDAVVASLTTVRQQGWNAQKLYNDGRWDRVNEQFNHRTGFGINMGITFKRMDAYIREEKTDLVGFDYYREILKIAHRDEIDLRLFVSPSHAWHWEAFRLKGLWSQFVALKRQLITINEQEAAFANKAPFPIWDFSGYNSITIENVPKATDEKQKMTWFWDPIHYKKSLGDLILNRVLGVPSAVSQTPDDLGILISSGNIEEHLNNINYSQQQYATQHKADIKEIMRIASKQ
jgi:hypothetical protein